MGFVPAKKLSGIVRTQPKNSANSAFSEVYEALEVVVAEAT